MTPRMRISTKHIAPEYLRSILHYEPTTGQFIWKVNRGWVKAGDIAGYFSRGHVRIHIDGVEYTAESLASLYKYYDPPSDADLQKAAEMVDAFIEIFYPSRKESNSES